MADEVRDGAKVRDGAETTEGEGRVWLPPDAAAARLRAGRAREASRQAAERCERARQDHRATMRWLAEAHEDLARHDSDQTRDGT